LTLHLPALPITPPIHPPTHLPTPGRDAKTGDSLNYGFIGFDSEKACEDAYFKMNNVLIDDRRIKASWQMRACTPGWTQGACQGPGSPPTAPHPTHNPTLLLLCAGRL
jgi:hypothetical protein